MTISDYNYFKLFFLGRDMLLGKNIATISSRGVQTAQFKK